MQIESGQEIARAEPEAGGQNARTPIPIDDGDVRRVADPVRALAVEDPRQDEGALGLRELG